MPACRIVKAAAYSILQACALLAAMVFAGCAQPESNPVVASTAEPETTPAATAPACQRWIPVEIDSPASFRGLSAANDQDVWVSGTGGTVGHSVDGGISWTFQILPESEALDFRDIDAFPGGIAYAMSAGPGEASQIHKTVDGGSTWTRQFLNPHQEGFLDGMAFWDAERGLAYGDPVAGAFFILRTEDAGATWTRVAAASMPPAIAGEAGFAASGTGLAVYDGGLALLGSGGAAARVFRTADFGLTWQVADTPIAAGAPSKGVFSLSFLDASNGVLVGGDYQEPETAELTAAITIDGGVSWTLASDMPSGFRSAVATTEQGLVSLGTSGADFSADGGLTWRSIAAEPAVPLNTLASGDAPCAVWAAGPDGVIMRWQAATADGEEHAAR